MNYKKLFSTVVLSALLSLQVSAYTVTPVTEAPQWQVDWSYNQERPDWQEPDASDYVNFSVMLVTIEEALQPYVSEDDLLALYVGDELRGLAEPALDMSTGMVDGTRFLLKAYGNENDGDEIDVTMKYYNAQLRQVFSRSTTMMYDVEVVLGIDEVFSPAFTLGSAKYPVVTTLDVADLLASAGITPAEGDIAAAFVGDECRGVADLTSATTPDGSPSGIDPDGSPSATTPDGSPSGITVFLREAGETVIVKYYDAARSRIITFGGSVTGDANGDGTVDVADIATVISVMAGQLPSEGIYNPRPLTISVSDTPFINPDASSAGARVGDYKSPSTSSVRRAAITTTSTLKAFNLDYTYGSFKGSATAAKANDGKWTSTGYRPDPDATVAWYAHNDGTFYQTDDANKAPYLSFTVNEEVANQKDLLVATAAGTWYDTNGNLSFTFDHACSALRFYMKKATNISDYTLTVTSVKLCNVVNHGDYYFNTKLWTPGTTTSSYTVFSGTAALGTTDYTAMDTSEKPYLILIPQTLTAWNPSASLANTYLELTCTLTKGGSTIHNGTAYIPFGATLEQGTQYDVKVNIGKNSLYSAANTKVIN